MTKTAIPAALLAATLLGACSGGSGGGLSAALSGRGLPPCPRVAMLGDAVDLTRFRAGARPDLATMEVDARLTGVQARCEYAPRNAGVDITLYVQVSAERGPAATGRSVQVPYFVAVTERDESRILNRGTDAVTIPFTANSNTNAVAGEEMMIRLPGDPNLSATRQILIGFVLSPDEVALNRRRGPRT